MSNGIETVTVKPSLLGRLLHRMGRPYPPVTMSGKFHHQTRRLVVFGPLTVTAELGF